MPVYEVGKKVCSPCATDTIQFDIQDGGALFVAKLGNPTKDEIQEFKQGNPQFKFLQLDGVIYFLAKFGSLEWMEAPFHRDLSSATKLPTNPPEGTGLNVHVMLIDAATGVLTVQRIVGLQSEFTRQLTAAIINQPSFKTRESYDRSVLITHMQYSIDQLANMAKNEN